MPKHKVDVTQKCATAGQHDALIDDVGGQFRCRMLERDFYRLDDRADRFGQAFRDLAFGNDQFLWHPVHEVAAFDFHGPAIAVVGRTGRTDLFLDTGRRAFADQQVMIAADVGDDRFVHLVAADPHAPGIDDATQRQDRDFGGAAADVDDHRAGRLGHRQAGADGGRHRLLDQIHLAATGAGCRFLNRAALDGGRTGRHADDDKRAGKAAAVVNLADEVLDHLLGDFEVGDDAVPEWPDGADVTGRAAEHLLGLLADRQDLLFALHFGDGHDRGLVQDDASALDIDQRVRGAEINRHVGRKKSKQF